MKNEPVFCLMKRSFIHLSEYKGIEHLRYHKGWLRAYKPTHGLGYQKFRFDWVSKDKKIHLVWRKTSLTSDTYLTYRVALVIVKGKPALDHDHDHDHECKVKRIIIHFKGKMSAFHLT